MSLLLTRIVSVRSFFLAAMASATSRSCLPVTGTNSSRSIAAMIFFSSASSLIFLILGSLQIFFGMFTAREGGLEEIDIPILHEWDHPNRPPIFKEHQQL